MLIIFSFSKKRVLGEGRILQLCSLERPRNLGQLGIKKLLAPKLKPLNTISHQKKLVVIGEKVDSVPGAGNVQDEPGTSRFITKQESYQRYRHYVKKKQEQLAEALMVKIRAMTAITGSKQTKYVKIHIFIMTPENKDSQVNFAECQKLIHSEHQEIKRSNQAFYFHFVSKLFQSNQLKRESSF